MLSQLSQVVSQILMQIIGNLTVVNHLTLSLPKLKKLAGKELYYKLNLSLRYIQKNYENVHQFYTYIFIFCHDI